MATEATLAELVVRIKADAGQLESTLAKLPGQTQQATSKMQNALGRLKDQFKELLPALSLVALEEFARRSVEAGIQLVDLSEKTGINIETLSALDVVVRQNGGSITDLANGVKFMNRNISEAAHGNVEIAKTFQAVHLNAQQLNKLDTTEQLYAVLDAIGKLEKHSDQVNAGLKLMGKGFLDLGSLASQGADGIRKAVQYAQQIGAIITPEEAANLKEFNAQWQVFVTLAERLAQSGFAAVFRDLSKGFGYLSTSLNPNDYTSIYAAEGKLQGLLQSRATLQKSLDHDRSQNPTAYPEHFSDDNKALAQQDAAIAAFQQRIEDIKKLQDSANKDKPNGGLALGIDRTVITDYITQLKQKLEVDKADESQQAKLAAYYDIVNKAKEKGLTITPKERDEIYKLTDAIQYQVQVMNKLRDALSEALTEIIMNFKSAGDSAKKFIDDIASQIIKRKISDPLSNSIIGAIDTSSFGQGLKSFLGFGGARAGGGPVAGGTPYLVGEHGPEIYTPSSSGAITSNNRMGGGPVVNMTQVINVSAGVSQTVRSEMMSLLPAFKDQAISGVFQLIQRGGDAARAVGNRS